MCLLEGILFRIRGSEFVLFFEVSFMGGKWYKFKIVNIVYDLKSMF